MLPINLPKPIYLLVGLILLSSLSSLVAVYKLSTFSLSPDSTTSSIRVKRAPIFADQIVVDIQGAVSQPGVYEIALNARLLDAIKKAQGLSPEADRYLVAKSFNLAKKLIDGEKIYIPSLNESLSDQSETSSLLSINTASSTQLELLPGIGPVTAAKIVEHRPYSSLEELVSRKAIGAKTLAKIINMLVL